MPLLSALRDRLKLPTEPSSEARAPATPGFSSGLLAPLPTVAGSPPNQWPPPGSIRPGKPPQSLMGGRLTWDDQMMFGAGLPIILPPDTTTDEWRRLDLDSERIRGLPVGRLLEVLAEASPDVSRALWDFLRLTNPGFEATVYKPNSETPHPQGQKAVDTWLRTLTKRYGSVDVPIGRLHFGAFLRGALFSELVLDEDGRTAVDLVTPDPGTARFRQAVDPVLGRVWLLGQFQAGRFVDLSVRETVSYIPIDPAPAHPYGRSPAQPAIFSSLFLLGLLHDLRRVVAQQGYPRYDLAIVTEALAKATPPSVRQDPIQWKEWVDQTVADVQRAYNLLEPDSAFVHTDVVLVNKPTGAVSADALAGIDPLIRALERQLARGLKTMPLLMGIIEGASEANANRQWELQAAGIKAIQHLSESQLSEWGTLVCEAQGIDAECRWQFAELRAAEKYRDAMTDGLVIDNATKLWVMGVIGQEELAERTTGLKSDQKQPRLIPTTEQSYVPGATTNSATASGEPAETGSPGKPAKPPEKQVQESSESGGNKGEEAKPKPPAKKTARDIELDWPTLRVNGYSNGTATPLWRPAGQPLAYVPVEVAYDEGDRRRIVQDWDAAVPDGAGLLSARVPSDVPTDTSQPEPETLKAFQMLHEIAQNMREVVTTVRSREPVKIKDLEYNEHGRISRMIERVAVEEHADDSV